MTGQQPPLTTPPAATTAAPFLKWAGGKGQLLAQYEPFFEPLTVQPPRVYYEPFVGSGAVFFHLRGLGVLGECRLSDSNEELINVYQMVRDRVDALVDLLAEHRDRHGPDHYYAVRALDRQTPRPADYTDPVRAARMIYLNKTCYNGLWRVNSQGHFNVPMGRYANPAILDEPRLRAASAALQGVTVETLDFRRAVAGAGAGDFVYFDPPYVPLSATANFTSYSKLDFGEAEQRALADTFRALAGRGCRVMLSNSDVDFVRGLYEGFTIESVQARRAINTRPDRRGPVGEVVVLNY